MKLQAVDAEATIPRYAEIRQAIERSIFSGDLRPGDKVPSEFELMALHGCSRMTVYKALSQLASEGLIVRKRRSGSFVAMPRSQETVLQIHDIPAEVKNSGKSYRHSIVSRRVRGANREDALRLGVHPGSRTLFLTVVHYAAEVPFVFEDRLISLATVPDAERWDFASCPPGTWLLEHIPWTEAEHRIQAVPANAQQALHLEIDKDTPCLLVERKTWHAGLSITHARLHYPGNRHILVARFSPGNGTRTGATAGS